MNKISIIIDTFFKLNQPIRFIMVGVANTVLGYLCFVVLYLLFGEGLYKEIILLLSFLISASFSFINLKILVFRTKGNWLKEYYRTLISYIGTYFFNAILLFILADIFKVEVLTSQGFATLITAFASYYVHKIYSFSKK